MGIYKYEHVPNYVLEFWNDDYKLPEQTTVVDEAQFIDDMKKKLTNIADLKEQWKKVVDSFVKHKWIYRYINDKQKESLERWYTCLTDENTTYGEYKRAFRYICNFMGLPYKVVIIENMDFKKDKQDKDQWEISLKYSKGLAKILIPDGVHLIHVTPVHNINELIPSFRSKTKGKYMYPSKRVFFTVGKDIKPKQAGLEGKKTCRYTPKEEIKSAYIDPTYADFSSGAVYVETDKSIPVDTYDHAMEKVFKAIQDKLKGGRKNDL